MNGYRLIIVLSAVLTATVALTACGGSSDSSAGKDTASEAAAPVTTAGASSKVDLAVDPDGQLRYVPSSAAATVGSVGISLANTSGLPHNVAIKGTDFKTKVVSTGTETATADLKAGSYTYYCQVPGHEAAGMVGTLTVK